MMGVCGLRDWVLGLVFLVSGGCGWGAGAGPFAVEVLDGATSRGIPLVVLETTYGGRYVTDSNGLVAFDEGLAMGRDVFFRPRSDG